MTNSTVNDDLEYHPLWSAEIMYGKYKGRTVEYVYENDVGYWGWIQANNILVSWNLVEYVQEEKQDNAPVTALKRPGGSTWVSLYAIPVENTVPDNWEIPY